MVVPDGKEKSFSFKLPKNVVISLSILLGGLTLVGFTFLFDYVHVIKEVYKNQYLKIENTQLKEQVQTLQIKMNSVLNDVERIQKFEKKIKVMTGVEAPEKTKLDVPDQSSIDLKKIKDGDFKKSKDFLELEKSLLSTLSLPLVNLSLVNKEDFSPNSNTTIKDMVHKIASVNYKLQKTQSIVNSLENSLHQVDVQILDKESFFKSTPSILPTDGWVTSYFGPRRSHYAKRVKMHEGIDIGARSGTPIVSTADGVVSFAGKKPGFGNFIKIRHGYGVETIYAHAKKLFVKSGKIVKRGDLIAAVGSTGYSTGPHVHYEIRVNQIPVDPLYYILN